MSLLSNTANAAVEDGVYDIPQYKDLRTNKTLSSVECLAVNAYHEARSEGRIANIMVMGVVLNRVSDARRFPNGICDVVFKAKAFSWVGDKYSDEIKNIPQYKRLYRLAEYVLSNQESVIQMTEGADHYHSVRVSPWWNSAAGFKKIARVDNHIFYSSAW
jgi:N-acetylmuramoyl-L-alanine amidase